jgi:hypothetical protein
MMTVESWIAKLKPGDSVTVIFDKDPGVVAVDNVAVIIEPGEELGAGVASERMVACEFGYFDARGHGWELDGEYETPHLWTLRRGHKRIVPPKDSHKFRDDALWTLENVQGDGWALLSDEALQQILEWLREAGALDD